MSANLKLVESKTPGAVQLSYARLHTTFYVPGVGNVKNKFELAPKDQAGMKATSIELLPNSMVQITVAGNEGKPVTFMSACTNFDALVPVN